MSEDSEDERSESSGVLEVTLPVEDDTQRGETIEIQ